MPFAVAGYSSLFERLSVGQLEELMHDKPDPTYERPPCVIELERCPICPEWMPAGSRRFGQCGACGVRLPPC